ncbi:hypothetical protein IPJ72_05345 [Candidatus Peregrinibacteria bacterium]|nr:MAG: hypothetical protein IPJ72_05345 [Candidatus Peregrinibacteria bacterium]
MFKTAIVLLSAVLPAIAWLYLFLRHHRKNPWLVLITFIAGMIAAIDFDLPGVLGRNHQSYFLSGQSG